MAESQDKTPEKGRKPSKGRKQPGAVIFRRFRTTSSGKVLDAHDYGLRAWPIRVKK